MDAKTKMTRILAINPSPESVLVNGNKIRRGFQEKFA
jgi:hypothetical protein